jgi:hypothetical protein
MHSWSFFLKEREKRKKGKEKKNKATGDMRETHVKSSVMHILFDSTEKRRKRGEILGVLCVDER